MTQAILGKSTMTKKVIILLMIVLAKVISYPFFVIIPSLNHMTTRGVPMQYFIADTHFFMKILFLSCDRPFQMWKK